ncbi:TolB family protein [Streptosporangium canum]|uniref:TolB family protein n=1 Tax=Streptosporangium canum TaxID=324952 RepID=UPI00369C8A9C
MKHWAMAAGVALAVSTAAVAAPALASSQAAPVTDAVYFGYQEGQVQVLTDRRPGLTSVRIGGGTLSAQFSVAPDGRRIAWIDEKGRLRVGSASGDKVIAKDAAYGAPCLTPAWTADGKRVAYLRKGTAAAMAVAVAGADGKGVVDSGTTLGPCHLTWSADGRTLAGYAGDTAGVYLLDTRSRVSGKAPGIKLANHVESLSPDSRRVVVNAIGPNAPGGDGSWTPLFTPSIYDTKTGKKITIPVKGRLVGARYLRDGRLAVRVRGTAANTLVTLDASGRELRRAAEPAKARNLGLLGVLG